ncbi:hypothetical protein [Anaeromicropila herbilytica]|uniref:ABC-2 family transporter protein n=1 Tax=Anaeromicropila herbilytica TaxID=2785025 RepID=A0A7R7IBK7_9FIRM|nr:hypothetical protein [Anaeromicropila herbilytica]BCN28909.1 hypothetical protein bsdtb5_02040 [Anaeromicropila herbilytica]
MINLIRADLYKLSKMLIVKISVLLCFASAIGMAIILRGVHTGTFDTTTSTNASLLVDIMLVSLLGAIITGSFISDDFESKNVHSEIACGRGRFAIVISKTITYAIIIILITLPYALVAIIGYASGTAFAPLVGIPSPFFAVLSGATDLAPNGANIAKSILICVMIIYLYIARLSICLPIAFKVRKNIPVIVVGFLTAFVFDIILALSANIKGLSDFVNNLPYAFTLKMTLDASSTTILKAFLCSTAFIIVMVNSSYNLFRKDEIK